MRTLLVLTFICFSCDDAPETPTSEAPVPAEVVDEPAAVQQPVEVPTTNGFVEAKFDGELRRFEHLPSANNVVAANGTFLLAHRTEGSEENLKFDLLSLDVRELEFPATIQHSIRPMRIASMRYQDAQGEAHMMMLRDPPLQCESLDNLVLKCTFSGRAGTIEVTDGRMEIQLRTSGAADAIIRATGTD